MANKPAFADHLLTINFPSSDDWEGWVDLWCRDDTGNIDCVPDVLRGAVAHLVTPDGWLKQPDMIPNTPYKIARWSHIGSGHPKPPWIGTGMTPSDVRREWERLKAEAQARADAIIASRTDLYFIQSADGPIKIGLSGDVRKRIKGLQSSSPMKLALLCEVKGGGLMESDYHARFSAHRLHGEWFHPHPDILAEIERLNAEAAHDHP